jgi:hypothetical protein
MPAQGIAIPGGDMDNAGRRPRQMRPAAGTRCGDARRSLWGLPFPSRTTRQQAAHSGWG